MKLKNKLIPILTAGVVGVSPLITLSSCGDNGKTNGNIMEEYTPTIKQRTRANSYFDEPEDALNAYFDAVENKPAIFEQDLLYTLSRGLPQYISYISEYCEIKDQNYNIAISNIEITNTDSKKTISFDITLDVLYDFTGTKPEELLWYDLFAIKWDTQLVANVVFDFDTSDFNKENLEGQRSKMTTYAGATQFGISELNSTIQLKSEKGSYVDLNGIKHKVNDETGESKASHFIVPSETYWKDDKQKYNEIISEINDLLITHPGLQVFVLMLKYYMFNNVHEYYQVPNTIDFGSYYMGNTTLNRLYEYTNIDSSADALCGFNYCLDSINNYENLLKEEGAVDVETKTFTLPKTSPGGKTFSEITQNAFNGDITTYTNVGIPYEIKNLVIPNNYKFIQAKAFGANTQLEKIKFNHTGNTYPQLYENSFYKMSNVTTLDFSQYNTDDLSSVLCENAMKNIHLGNSIPTDLKEGQIIVPSGVLTDETAKAKWVNFVNKLGLKVWESGTQEAGWELVEVQ